ncbi:MAG: isovaleryl-CoA dehydrogenase [Acidimicrobiales bacterium]
MATHEVINQPPPLVDYDVFGQDRALVEAVHREGADWAAGDLHELGRLAGSADAIEWGFQANACTPVLRTHDRFGFRIDQVDYHPAYHRLMGVAVEHGLHAAPWADRREGAHVARAAAFSVWSQVEAGHGCPISMTYSVIPALRAQPDLAADWEPGLVSRRYDPHVVPAATKAGVLAGMALTEKQGGSDVRANTTRAEPLGAARGPSAEYRITGHKWFCSAPMSDVFLALAQAPGGLSCFLVPRWTPDGERNAIRLQRLKDKLGNRSNASSEIEFEHAWARMIGEEGRGIPTIIEMVDHTRLDCVIGSSSGMRQAVAQATHHAAHRRAFGASLSDQPLMLNVLADLAVESEAATLSALRLAGAYDRAAGDEHEALFRRLATPVVKYWVCKRQPTHVGEALECLGGNGYVEESILPRLYREAPVNGVWEGSGNVIVLDVLRAMARAPRTVDAFFDEVDMAAGADVALDTSAVALRKDVEDIRTTGGAAGIEGGARRLVERMALVLQGALLVRHGHPAVADAFCASRLGGDWGVTLGTLPSGVDARTIIDRARPDAA